MKTLPLKKDHEIWGARFINSAGWSVPLLYWDIIMEHLMVRESCGLFDVSYMGKIIIFGMESKQNFEKISTNTLPEELGQARYTHIVTRKGMIIDDVIISKIDSNQYLCICNAPAEEKILSRIKEISDEQGTKNVADDYTLFAVQGPNSERILQTLTSYNLNNLKRFNVDYVLYEIEPKISLKEPVKSPLEMKGVGPKNALESLEVININGHQVQSITSRTGYTGEDGFEILASKRLAGLLWNSILTSGKNEILPIGVGARNTLRLEKGFLLAGCDYDGTQTPLETGHERFIKWDHEFDAKDVLLFKKDCIEKKLVGILCSTGKVVPRKGTKISYEDEQIGTITSGAWSPCLKKGIGLGYVKIEFCTPGQLLNLHINSNIERAEVVKLPFI